MPRAKADSNKPRGRMTAYAYFMQTCRQEHKNKHPDETVVFLELSKKCAGQWKVILIAINVFFSSLVCQFKNPLFPAHE